MKILFMQKQVRILNSRLHHITYETKPNSPLIFDGNFKENFSHYFNQFLVLNVLLKPGF